MDIEASLRYVRTAPRKMRLVIDTIRGCSVADAEARLALLNKRAVEPLQKLLRSAVANAEHNFELKKTVLYIKEIFVNEGPMLKRWMPRAHGRATQLLRRSSHVVLVLSDRVASTTIRKKQTILSAPAVMTERPHVKEEDADEEKKEVNDEKQSDKVKKAKPKKTKLTKGFSRGAGSLRRFFQRKSG